MSSHSPAFHRPAPRTSYRNKSPPAGRGTSRGVKLGACLLALVACLAFWAAPRAGAALGGGAARAVAGTQSESPLVVPGVQALDGGQQAQAQRQASLANPEAIAARKLSRTEYAHLDGAQAASLALQAFPEAIGQVVDPAPQLQAGQSIVGYPSDNAAQIDLGAGKRSVVNSTVPLAAVGPSGQRVPLDLGLSKTGSGFAPTAAAVGVQIPKRLGDGVALSELGVSLTPVDGEGSPLGGAEGVIDGASVFYANTQTSVDTAVKPLPSGFDEQTLLRSAETTELFFRVGLPEGARLAQEADGAVRVMDHGGVLAWIAALSARDAAGVAVPVSMGVSGDTLKLTVDDRGEYLMPIAVDPTVVNSNLYWNWRFEHEGGSVSGAYHYEGWQATYLASHVKEEWGALRYPAQGESRIYEFTSETSGSDEGANLIDTLGILNSSKALEAQETLPASYGRTSKTLCVEAGCPSTAGKRENLALYEQATTNTGAEGKNTLYTASVYLAQNNGPSISFETEPTLPGGQRNVLAGSGSWLGSSVQTNGGQWEAEVSDPGVGVSEWTLSSPSLLEWRAAEQEFCYGVMCPEKRRLYGEYKIVTARYLPVLPDGEDTIQVKAQDLMGLSASAKTPVKVDGTPPFAITVSGLPANHEIGSSQYRLTLSATDGKAPVPSSGVGSLAFAVDGKEVGKAAGSCTPGPCTGSRELTVSGSEFPVGPDTVTVTATDNAGNSSKEELTMFVSRRTSPVAAGPGSMNPESGELNLLSTDASISSPGSPLTVSRSYGSLHLEAGAEGPLGPQWSLGLGGVRNLTKLPNGSVLLTDGTGLQAIFTSAGGGEFTAPKGDGNLKIKEVTNKEGKTIEFMMATGSGVTTRFTLPGGAGSVWAPTTQESVGGLGVTTTTYQTVKGILEPVEILAPPPSGVSCTTKLVRGCRALGFVYASKTTAGTNESEWGDYENHLREATLTAYDPAKGQVKTVAVAQYQYDKAGRLRAEWDPRVSPALKTTYGYDAAGRVTSVTSAGQQPWTFTYGAIAGDTRMGRVLAITRPNSSTEAGDGEAPVNTEAPKLSTSNPAEGAELKVTTGAWSNKPLSYSYQWESCNSAGKECTPILGATNPAYTPLYKEEEHALVAQVTAINATGATTIASAASNAVPAKAFPATYASQFGKEGSLGGQFKSPTYATSFGSTDYVADTGNNRIESFYNGTYLSSFGTEGIGQLKEPAGIAVDNNEDIFVADSGNKRIVVFNSARKYVTERVTSGAPVGIAVNGRLLYVVDSGTNEVEVYEYYNNWLSKLKTFGTEGSGEGQLKAARGIAYSYFDKSVYVTDAGSNHLDQYEVNGTAGKFVKLIGMKAGSGNDEFKEPTGVSVDHAGNLWVVDTGNNRVQEFTPEGSYYTQFGSTGKKEGQFIKPIGIDCEYCHDPLIVDSGNNRVEEFAAGERPADPPVAPATPPKPGTSAVTTIEYHVPVSGEGAPYAMGSSDVAAWGQEDNPSEATAVYPPDQPMGWPAQQYKRASVYYLDSNGHTVNMAQPGGSITTREYNAVNDVTRTLSAADRQVALGEGGKSAAASKLLDTQSTYSKEGNLLEKTLGPQHTVKLKDGEEALTRRHTQYYYDEGAPKEGGPYGLPTKMTIGAELSGGKEEDVRTSTTSYGGQGNLGWKLHQPTAVTADPGGLGLTHKTVYEAATGNVSEATMPAGAEAATLPVFDLKFGSFGSKEGQFEAAWGLAVDQKSSNVYVSDYTAGRIEKFSSGGTFLTTIGSKGSGEGQVKGPEALTVSSAGNVYVGDTGNHRVEEFSASGKYLGSLGKAGSGEGQFASAIGGVVTDSSGNVWVSDTNDSRVEEFSSQGKYLRGVGSEGGGNGQFYGTMGLTISGGNLYVADLDNNRVQEFNLEGKYLGQFGGYGEENGQLKEPWAITSDSSGDLYVSDRGPDRVQEFNSSGEFVAWLGSYGNGEGQFYDPQGIGTSASGALYVADLGNSRVDEWTPGNQGAHASRTIYYTATANSEYPSCGNHAEWANLACEALPAKQPETPGLPQLATATYTYNVWDEPEKTAETVGSTTRTKTAGYDAAGRLLSASTSSSAGTALPAVTDKYDSKTGALTVQSATTEGKTLSLEATYNTLGQLTSYTDADGNATSYTYDIDGRPETINDGKGTQTYTYDPTTGLVSALKDTAAVGFTMAATYNSEGNLLTESYPNGMTANYTYDPTGRPRRSNT